MGRTRSMSNHGLYLLNIAYQEKPKTRKIFPDIKKHLYNLFHTEYDDKVDIAVKQFKKGSEKLFALYGKNKDSKEIAQLINNAITQIILI